MPHGRPPISTTTRLYGHFAYSTVQRPMSAPALMNALLERRGVDALFVLLQVPPEHLAATIADMRHLRDFAGFCVTMPHKAAVAQLCDVLRPNAQACKMSRQCCPDRPRWPLDRRRRLMVLGWSRPLQRIGPWILRHGSCWSEREGSGRPLPWHLPWRASVPSPSRIAPRPRPTTWQTGCDVLPRLREVEAGAVVDPAGFDIVIDATSLGQNRTGPLPLGKLSRGSVPALVADVVAVPEYTPLLQAAQARGLGIVRGSEMLMPQIETAASFLVGPSERGRKARGRRQLSVWCPARRGEFRQPCQVLVGRDAGYPAPPAPIPA